MPHSFAFVKWDLGFFIYLVYDLIRKQNIKIFSVIHTSTAFPPHKKGAHFCTPLSFYSDQTLAFAMRLTSSSETALLPPNAVSVAGFFVLR